MTISTMATYRDGVLMPVHELGLRENQKVKVTVTVSDVDSETLDELDGRLSAWLATEPSRPSREPLEFSDDDRRRLDDELDGILSELHEGSRCIEDAEVIRDVDEATEAARNR